MARARMQEPNLPKKSSLKKLPSRFEVVPDDDEDVIIVDRLEINNNISSSNSKESILQDPAVNDYVYNTAVIDTSAICDFGFRNLENVLKLSQNELVQLKENDYEKVSFSHNALKRIPNNFFTDYPKLQLLLVLDLSCNQLTFIPNDIDHLANLTHLNLFLNKLRCLPPSLGRLTQLKWLNIARNPDLFKSKYLRTLAGPMLTEEQCFECSQNIKTWINKIVESRGSDYLLDTYIGGKSKVLDSIQRGPELGIDEHLVRYYPDNGDSSTDITRPSRSKQRRARSNAPDSRRHLPFLKSLLWLGLGYLTIHALLLFISIFFAPFILNEPSRRDWTRWGLTLIPEFLCDLSIWLGKLVHNILWGLPCIVFRRKECSYCSPPQPPGPWELIMSHWQGFKW